MNGNDSKSFMKNKITLLCFSQENVINKISFDITKHSFQNSKSLISGKCDTKLLKCVNLVHIIGCVI